MQQQQHFPAFQEFDTGCFNTSSGKIINLNNPTEDMIDIRDIASSLSKICRFGGHTNQFYSVAQHCVLVAAMAPDIIKKEALLHDASEAYLQDIGKPLKHQLGRTYRKFEVLFEHVISLKFSLKTDDWTYDEIKKLDREILELEHEAFQKGNFRPFDEMAEKYNLILKTPGWAPEVAEMVFLASFADYSEPITNSING